MQLLVVRHAIAVDQEDWDGDDEQRPLTDEGRKKMKRVAEGLTQVVERVDVLAASPLVRAHQTAEILAAAYGDLAIKSVPALAPNQPPTALARWLKECRSEATVAVVGHEPHLSHAVSWLLAGSERAFLEMKKGGALLLSIPRDAAAASAELVWSLWPSHLRQLGD